MSGNLLFLLLRASLSASLSDREAFVNGVAKVIEEHTRRNPEEARRIGNHLAGAAEGLNNGLLFNQLFAPRHDKRLNKTLEELTETIGKLNALIEEAGVASLSFNGGKS
ncbi:MAG: hypothetical protein K2O69_01635 [Odoribacter sp.]|nr:hypothetical protein [Odoribacter sp.]